MGWQHVGSFHKGGLLSSAVSGQQRNKMELFMKKKKKKKILSKVKDCNRWAGTHRWQRSEKVGGTAMYPRGEECLPLLLRYLTSHPRS